MAREAPTTYPVGTIAALLMLTERRVQQLATEGVIPKAARGRFELAPAVQGYIKFLQERSIGGDADTKKSLAAEQLKLAAARAALAEIELAERRGELLDAEEWRSLSATLVAEATSNLLNNLPVRIAAQAKAMKSEAKIKALVRDEVRQALSSLSSLPVQQVLGDPVVEAAE